MPNFEQTGGGGNNEDRDEGVVEDKAEVMKAAYDAIEKLHKENYNQRGPQQDLSWLKDFLSTKVDQEMLARGYWDRIKENRMVGPDDIQAAVRVCRLLEGTEFATKFKALVQAEVARGTYRNGEDPFGEI